MDAQVYPFFNFRDDDMWKNVWTEWRKERRLKKAVHQGAMKEKQEESIQAVDGQILSEQAENPADSHNAERTESLYTGCQA